MKISVRLQVCWILGPSNCRASGLTGASCCKITSAILPCLSMFNQCYRFISVSGMALHDAALHGPESKAPQEEEDEVVKEYLKRLCLYLEEADLFQRRYSEYSKGPTRLSDHLYLGDFGDADSLGQLTEIGITHMLNCACAPPYSDQKFYRDRRASFRYMELDAEDRAEYDISKDFQKAFGFIKDAKASGGKVLVYCRMGMNRSAAVCIAYLMAEGHGALMDTVRRVRKLREHKILTNLGFQKTLVRFARDHKCLESKWKTLCSTLM